ncbi:MAG: acetate kinase [Chloroflexi bacterium]|nr:acetate kinase [Chloroflexota bacterium]
MKILVANVGSTSFKYQLIEMEGEQTLAIGKVERIGSAKAPLSHQVAGMPAVIQEIDAPDHTAAIKQVLALLCDPRAGCIADLSQLSAVGFKAVHAGCLSGAVLVTDEVITAMEEYNDVAPAHNPPYIAAMCIFQSLIPQTPLVALFETAFHTSMPAHAYTYGLPYEWYEKYGVRRYGFHGASFRYICERVPQILGVPKEGLRLIACHLGGSSSICAIQDGRSIDTSMGFSPQAGVSMSTRCGDIDPFVIPYIMERKGLTTREIRECLIKRGGLLGISGLSGDVRDLEEAARSGDQRAALALDVFVYEIKKYIGAYAAALSGVDALAFAGGIGENSVEVRRRVCSGLEFLGIRLDPQKNNCRRVEAIISRDGARVKVLVVPTNEEIIVARETARLVGILQEPRRK